MNVLLQISPSVRAGVPLRVQRALVRRISGAGRGIGLGRSVRVTIRITDDAEVERLHVDFMGLPGPTDVLSFPAEDDESSLGDLVIGWPFAQRQSQPRGVGPGAWEAEVVDLALHGLAHLLGHDHATRSQARSMLRLEQRLARRAAMPPPQRPYR